MGLLHSAIDHVLHIDRYLNQFAGDHPVGVYGLLVAIVFCETGLVVTPFLPGDSLLFAVGALAATEGSHFSLPLTIILLCVAANCGDLVNYALGRNVGPRVFRRDKSLLFNRKYLEEAQAFYDRHGVATIVMARFVPIVRTFAPFVAGVGRMPFAKFAAFSVTGGVFWVTLLSVCGYLFGGIPWVKAHFEIVVLAVIVVSLIPMAVHALQARRRPAQGFEPVAPNRIQED